jgi:hypothetical protein
LEKSLTHHSQNKTSNFAEALAFFGKASLSFLTIRKAGFFLYKTNKIFWRFLRKVLESIDNFSSLW